MGGFFSIPSWNDTSNATPTPAVKGGKHRRTYKKRKNERFKTRK